MLSSEYREWSKFQTKTGPLSDFFFRAPGFSLNNKTLVCPSQSLSQVPPLVMGTVNQQRAAICILCRTLVSGTVCFSRKRMQNEKHFVAVFFAFLVRHNSDSSSLIFPQNKFWMYTACHSIWFTNSQRPWQVLGKNYFASSNCAHSAARKINCLLTSQIRYEKDVYMFTLKSGTDWVLYEKKLLTHFAFSERVPENFGWRERSQVSNSDCSLRV